MPQIESSSFLTLHYRLSGPQGNIINTFDGKPATLSLGTGELAPAMEQHLLGLEEGTHTTFDLPAGAAFGERNAEMIQWVAKKLLALHGDPLEKYSIGDVVQFPAPVRDALSGGGAHPSFAGAVREVHADKVLFDFNHPLAGQPVSFEVHVIGVL